MIQNIKRISAIALILAFSAGPVSDQDAPFISKSLFEETATAPNGAISVADALTVNKLMGAEKKIVHEITDGVYHIRGWGLAHTIAIDAPEGWVTVDTGDSTKSRVARLASAVHKLPAFLVAICVVGFFFVTVPYFAFSPKLANLFLIAVHSAFNGLIIYLILIIANPFSIPAPIESKTLEMLMNKDMADVLTGLKGG